MTQKIVVESTIIEVTQQFTINFNHLNNNEKAAFNSRYVRPYVRMRSQIHLQST